MKTENLINETYKNKKPQNNIAESTSGSKINMLNSSSQIINISSETTRIKKFSSTTTF